MHLYTDLALSKMINTFALFEKDNSRSQQIFLKKLNKEEEENKKIKKTFINATEK